MKTQLHNEIDGIHKALAARGIALKRADVIEALASARGFRNSHAMLAAAQPIDPPAKIIEAADCSEQPLSAVRAERDQLREDIASLERICHLDWPAWNKTLKSLAKHSHHGKIPLDDDALELLRLAVSDNHAKSSAAERHAAEYRVMEFARRQMPGLLARLDHAEELLGKGPTISGPVLEAMRSAMIVQANRDGDSFEQVFLPPNDEADPDAIGVELAAKSFGIAEMFRADEGYDEYDRAQGLEAEMDSCSTDAAYLTIQVADCIDALARGEGSSLMHNSLMQMARDLGLDPRGAAGVIYPPDEG